MSGVKMRRGKSARRKKAQRKRERRFRQAGITAVVSHLSHVACLPRRLVVLEKLAQLDPPLREITIDMVRAIDATVPLDAQPLVARCEEKRWRIIYQKLNTWEYRR